MPGHHIRVKLIIIVRDWHANPI